MSGLGDVRVVGGLAPGKPSGEPLGYLELVQVQVPGHSYDAAGDSRRPESQDARDHGLTDIRRCEHGAPLVIVNPRNLVLPVSLKHMIEREGRSRRESKNTEQVRTLASAIDAALVPDGFKRLPHHAVRAEDQE